MTDTTDTTDTTESAVRIDDPSAHYSLHHGLVCELFRWMTLAFAGFVMVYAPYGAFTPLFLSSLDTGTSERERQRASHR